jgi:NAD(P)-dependent dehydrogenase (short-subunit alcohol dehydrogenase family)
MADLEGRVALVTGASRGIGLAIAQALAGAGARVVICARSQKALEAAAAADERLIPFACHVGRAAEVEQLTAAVEALGGADILVNNAATNIAHGPALEMTDEQFDKMVEINLKSAFRLVRRLAPGMGARRRGSIINIASVAGLRPLPLSMLYSMTKAALIMMTRSLALELGPQNVRVNAIAPGWVKTALSQYYWSHPERLEGILARQPIQRLGTPEEIAQLALYLAGDASAYVTGQVFIVDGGHMIS